METTYENECTTIQEQKCEIQYMTQYEQQCSTQNENVSNDYGLLYFFIDFNSKYELQHMF